MRVGDLEFAIKEALLEAPIPDDLSLRIWNSANRILNKDLWSFSKVYTTELLRTTVNRKEYSLPPDFSEFLRREGKVTLRGTDGTSDFDLQEESAEEFFRRDITSQTNSQPKYFTTTFDSDRWLIFLNPTPDDEYTFFGAYRRRRFPKFTENSHIPDAISEWVIADVLVHLESKQEFQIRRDQAEKSLAESEGRLVAPKLAPQIKDFR